MRGSPVNRRPIQRLRQLVGSVKIKLLLGICIVFALILLASSFDRWKHRSNFVVVDNIHRKGYTLLINTWKRNDLLKKSISHYAECPRLDSVHIVWSEPDPPSESLSNYLDHIVQINRKDGRELEIMFDINKEDSLNNRFKENNDLKTDVVLSIDDDVILPCSSVELAFSTWLSAPDTMVGFVPRMHWLQQSGDSQDRYAYGGWWSVWWMGTYSMVLSKAAFFHKKYLTMYSNEMSTSIKEYIAHNRNCEDIAMSFLVANATGAPPIWVKAKIYEIGSTGISSLGGHSQKRTECVNRLRNSKNVELICRVSENDDVQSDADVVDEEKDEHVSVENGSLIDSNAPSNSETTQEKEQVTTEVINSESNSIENNQVNINGQGGVQGEEGLEVASGSPLPGLKPQQLDEADRIPKATIDILRDQVFGFDTFFITGQEPYEGGVLFKGNLRGVPSKSYEKISKRMKDKFGDQYKLFMLTNPEDDKPVAVVVSRKILQPETTAVPEWFAAVSFGLVTVFTLLLRNVPELQSDLLSSFDKLDLLKDGLSGAIVTALILGVHELGHYLVAKDCGVKLGVPFFVPSWQIGSFGAITRIVNIVPKREDLLKIAAAGPLAGYTLGLLLFLIGFFIPPSDGLGVVVDASVFHESLLAGGIAKLLLGDVLKEGQSISLNPLVIWAWAGLLINAINSIPAGELDGGRISFAIWGRKASARLTGASIVLLGLSSLFSDVAFYWVALIFFLQRSSIAPLSEEISEPDNKYVGLGIAVLLIGLLVCLPYPFPFSTEAMTTFLES